MVWWRLGVVWGVLGWFGGVSMDPPESTYKENMRVPPPPLGLAEIKTLHHREKKYAQKMQEAQVKYHCGV